jgi:hypothetical protein
VVRSIRYGEDEIVYTTFDKSSREVLRLRHPPTAVWAGSSRLPQVKDLRRSRQGYSVEPAAGGGAVVRIQHQRSSDIRISWKSAERLEGGAGFSARTSVQCEAGGSALVVGRGVPAEPSSRIAKSAHPGRFALPPGGRTARGSSAQPGFEASGAVDKDRFAPGPGHSWKGEPDLDSWWWQIEFRAPRRVGALLQVVGDHEFVFTNAPTAYVWQASDDGQRWRDLAETRMERDRRLFRVHRL